jgi:two-component system, LuxR family, response regulator FixJ
MDLIEMPPKRCVHIVDDEARVRDALTVLLSTAEIESRSYRTAEEFLESTQLTEPACILLDNQLPGMSGLELLKRIVGDASNSRVIMITGHGDIPTAVSAMKVGAFNFVEKPFDAEALLITIEEAFSCVDKDRYANEEIEEIRGRYALLTSREQDVFALLLEGLPTKVISYRLGISARTTEHHRAVVMQKMQARNISQVVRMALKARNLDSTKK